MFRNFYRDFGDGRTVDWWNAVDVKRDDGFLQHGTVVDVLSTGVLIDFGCRGLRKHFIPYGQALEFPKKEHSETEIPVGNEVLVLLREASDGPWIWYPAKLLAPFPVFDGSSLALVGLELRGGYSEKIVCVRQLRMPPSSADLEASMIHATSFVRRVCILPGGGGWSSAAEGIVLKLIPRTLSRNYQAYPIHLYKKHLTYFQRATSTALDSTTLNVVTAGAQYEIAQNKQAGRQFLEDGWRCLLRTVQPIETDLEEWDMNLLHVNMDILGQVFHYASSMERVQFRRVCPWFNGIINNKARFTDIVIHYRNCPVGSPSKCRRCGSYRKEYSVVASLVNCMTSYVKSIIFTTEYEFGDFFAVPFLLDALHRVRTLGLAKASLLVVTQNCSFFEGVDWFHSEVKDFAKNLQATGICTKLLLHKCSVNRFEWDMDLPKRHINGIISTSSAEKDVWDVVESSLPAVDIQLMAEWVSRSVLEQSYTREGIAEVLVVFSGDPRPSGAYSNQEWTVDNLGTLDVAKLSVLCRYALSLKKPACRSNVSSQL